MIIIAGVYRISKNPRIPEKEKTMYNTNPTTTGGKLIRELTIKRTKFLPVNSFIVNKDEIYIDIIAAMIVANKDTCNDKKIISINL